MPETGAGAETRQYVRSAGLLSAGVGLAGVLTYVYFAIASHNLSEEDYGAIVVLWSAAFLVSSTMFRPVEQLLAHRLADHDQSRLERRHVLREATLLQLGMCGLVLAVLLAFRPTVTEELFDGNTFIYWMLLAALAGFAMSFWARGFLAGRGQFRFYASLLILEVALRLSFVLMVAVGLASGADFVAAGIPTVALSVAIVLPFAIHRLPLYRDNPEGDPVEIGQPVALTSGRTFTGAVLVMMIGEQILISSGALILQIREGPTEAGFIFNVLLVARAPLVLFGAVVASMLPHLTRVRASGGPEGRTTFIDSVDRTLKGVALFATAVTVGVLAVGPQVMDIAFGGDFTYDRTGLAIVAVGMGLYLAGVTLNQAALASGRAKQATLAWIASAATFVIVNLVGAGDPFRAVEVGFALAALVLAAGLAMIYPKVLADPVWNEAVDRT